MEESSPNNLEYAMNHVFLPPKLPQRQDTDEERDLGDVFLCQSAYDAAKDYNVYLTPHQRSLWVPVIKMLKHLLSTTQDIEQQDHVDKILNLADRETIAFHIRAQNAGLILRKNSHHIVFEVFEVAPPPGDVMGAEGKLLCSYPGPAVEVPLSIPQDRSFVEALVSFLSQMDLDKLDSVATTTKAGSTVEETRATTDPKYITQLLTAILLGMGQEAGVERITKRIADEVCWDNADNPWRRSSLWLVLRVAAQRSSETREIYKAWMLLLHARLLETFLKNNFSSDLLFTARVKTSRRAYKLRSSAPSTLLKVVKDMGNLVEVELQARWSKEQDNQASSPSYIPNSSTIENDTTLSLLKSQDYLAEILRRKISPAASAEYRPNEKPRLRDSSISEILPDDLAKAIQIDPYLALADFENLIEDRLDDWTSTNIRETSASNTLKLLSDQYISAAQKHYESNPEDQSLMLLTILHLWVALDKVVCAQIPLLSLYSPEIPTTILDPLLLRRRIHLARAAQIGRYLRDRHSAANTDMPSIYSSDITSDIFSVRYFEQTPALQKAKQTIEKDATIDRESKCSELRDLNSKHEELVCKISGLDCQYDEWHDWLGLSRSRHSAYCYKCSLTRDKDSMTIYVHEWPLPEKVLQAKATVFEINCPPAFLIWRDLTYCVLRDIGLAHVRPNIGTKAYGLPEYAGLMKWSNKSKFGRIVLASSTKSFLVAHYRTVDIPSTKYSVCVNNGLNFGLYDKIAAEFAHSNFDNINLYPCCTLLLPKKSDSLYQHLQYAVTRTTHSHNSTIVKQSDCPIDLNIHEQLAFTNLRCGAKLQWLNIIRELHVKALTFSRDEVHTLLMQAAWQVGPLDHDGHLRLWHAELSRPDFGSVLIQAALELLLHVEGNWMEGNTVKTLIYLIGRLLVSIDDANRQSEIVDEAYSFLQKARRTTYDWMQEIQRQTDGISGDDDAALGRIQRQACEMAAICRSTYDVDSGAHLTHLLSSCQDASVLMECAMVIHRNTPPSGFGESFPDLQRLLDRDRRLSHHLEATLANCILADKSGLDMAIRSVWSDYPHLSRPERWQQLPMPDTRWVTSMTKCADRRHGQTVFYNMLNGKLLIDGKPLGRLPQEILGHPIYKRVFGQKIFDVIPAAMEGMDYATPFTIDSTKIFFKLHCDMNSLIIRTEHVGTGDIFELVPHDVLAEDFPYIFTSDYIHWMNTTARKVEFRPFDRLWKHGSTDWVLYLPENGNFFMQREESQKYQMLVDIRSETFKGIAGRLFPLEQPSHLTIFCTHDCQVVVDLPRFGLCFYLNAANELESTNMRDMVIDDNQCTGTMIGLRNQLVLRHKHSESTRLPRSRLVIIPYGAIHSSMFSQAAPSNHVHVHITHSHSERQITWYKYDIDTDLGMLVGDVSLSSRLFRVYLHALCSHPLPDPLTLQRGTEHALQELQAAGSFSFQQLTDTDLELFDLIAKISPNRQYYPVHLRVMQTTTWSPSLPALSQHDSFGSIVSKILHYAQSLTIFPELHQEITLSSCSDLILTARASRNAVYYRTDIKPSSNSDGKHFSRDSRRATSAEMEALKTSHLVHTWPMGLTVDLPSSGLLEIYQSWGTVKGVNTDMTLVYSKEWLHLDLSAQWMTIYDACRRVTQSLTDKFSILFSFASLAYSKGSNVQNDISILLACCAIDGSLLNQPPQCLSYDLRDGFEPLRQKVLDTITANLHPPRDSPVARLPRHNNEDFSQYEARQDRCHRDLSQAKIKHAVDNLMDQWPCPSPCSPFYELDASEWFEIGSIMKNIGEYFASCYGNRELRTFSSHLSDVLRQHRTISPLELYTLPKLCFSPKFNIARLPDLSITLEVLMSRRSTPSLPCSLHKFGASLVYVPPRASDKQVDTAGLTDLVAQFRGNHTTALHQMYHKRLDKSQKELDDYKTLIFPGQCAPIQVCTDYRERCQDRLCRIFSSICEALAPSTLAEKVIEEAGLWPPITQRTVSQLLASTSMCPTAEWLDVLITFAEAFIEYQYACRLVGFSLHSEAQNFFKELRNASFCWSDARKYPVWLLIQIGGNFITRPLQSLVAREMIAPSSQQSSVSQLNMGEGKSHVIVPLVATALADSQTLVRVVVLKALSRQMFQLLVERVSGIANHRVFFLPFSRDVKATPQSIKTVRELLEECARVRGILVVQPEHILSLQLMVIDSQILLSEGHQVEEVSQDLHAVQRWLDSNARDILDESDELLHARYQLIYTRNEQRAFDGGADRWITAQGILSLVSRHMRALQAKFPVNVAVVDGHDTKAGNAAFPYFRLLGTSASASSTLIEWIVSDILEGRVDNITFIGLGSQLSLRSNLRHFLQNPTVDHRIYSAIKKTYETTALWKPLLVLRGLLAHGILVYVLSQRRWRVDYGLDPKRSMLSVPYRAKDVPSLRSEFGHPDIIVCLTCLSYYYEGLTYDQTKECFEIVSKLDNPTLEYDNWVRRAGDAVPSEIRHFIGVNMKDVNTFEKTIFPVFRFNKCVIDLYLSRVVFPKEAKEFPYKLGTSGWDLAATKANPTTGFSGTNDNFDLLPTSITQSDPVNQIRTNALVLEYILRSENRVLPVDIHGRSCSAAHLLDVLVKSEGKEEIRVLLDVGAQMLEMKNRDLVFKWLSLLCPTRCVAAGIFFDDFDNLSVITREGQVEPFHSSPFRQRLSECIVYLDDAHTRGTDLKLPPDFRALVTLGPKVTKDKLAQGCMRMRNLGHGQSVVFCTPLEVDRDIRRLEKLGPSDQIQVVDVLSWAMFNTCEDIKTHIPHWVQQGINYHKREAGYQAFANSDDEDIEPLKDAWLEPAARSLEEMYGPKSQLSNIDVVKNIPDMYERLKKLGITEVSDESMAEEQEREVSHEVEEETQVERPPEVEPAKHQLHDAVRAFVRRGVIPTDSADIFRPLTALLFKNSSLSTTQNIHARLLGTRDFATTTQRGNETSELSDYLRPVNWILSHTRQDGVTILLVISPYEANALLDDIRRSRRVCLHIYAPRTSLSTGSFDDLSLYCVSSLHWRHKRVTLFNDTGYLLNIWAGQLYFDSRKTYLRVCLLLGLASSDSNTETFVGNDRFVAKHSRTAEMAAVCLFDESPAPVLKMLFDLRRKGMSYQSTHLGKILQARLLLEDDLIE